MPPKIIDLFAGPLPGGWSEGLRALGYAELGIEWDEAACLTARAAGHERLQADVAALDPMPCWGLIASPPCQAWSMAGKGGGRRDKRHVVACAGDLAAGNDTRALHAALCEDARSMLVVEPLRWALATRPEWIAMEQVPPVLELWTMFAQILTLNGSPPRPRTCETRTYPITLAFTGRTYTTHSCGSRSARAPRSAPEKSMPYKDPDAQRRYQRERAAQRRTTFMAGMSCVDCGATKHLELDHRDPTEKESHRIWSWSKQRILAEIAKCDPRCRPCHIARHQTENRQAHGQGAYKRGCRCKVCRAAKAESQHGWLARRAHAAEVRAVLMEAA